MYPPGRRVTCRTGVSQYHVVDLLPVSNIESQVLYLFSIILVHGETVERRDAIKLLVGLSYSHIDG